jgi:hypothetical protein
MVVSCSTHWHLSQCRSMCGQCDLGMHGRVDAGHCSQLQPSIKPHMMIAEFKQCAENVAHVLCSPMESCFSNLITRHIQSNACVLGCKSQLHAANPHNCKTSMIAILHLRECNICMSSSSMGEACFQSNVACSSAVIWSHCVYFDAANICLSTTLLMCI